MGAWTRDADRLAERLTQARRVVALTGAGVSTSCGIPDFRGPKGIYVTRRYPEDVFDIQAFRRDPTGFFAFARDFLALDDRIEPSLAHRVLAEWEGEGRLDGIVTQNIDGLHQRAGSRRVVELHGGFETASCTGCGLSIQTAELRPTIELGGIPVCESCGGVVKPDIVFFGENVKCLDEAMALVAGSDLLLVLGSSLSVFPAASLPRLAGGEIVVIAQGPVMLPLGATHIDACIDDVLGEVHANISGRP